MSDLQPQQSDHPTLKKQAAPNDAWCVGCDPDNCCGCPPAAVTTDERRP